MPRVTKKLASFLVFIFIAFSFFSNLSFNITAYANEKSIPDNLWIGITHSPLVEGETQSFYALSKFDDKVQYRLFINKIGTDVWEEATTGYTEPVDGNIPYLISYTKAFTKGNYKGVLWVKAAGTAGIYSNKNGDYDKYQIFGLNCVGKDESKLLTTGDLDINNTEISLGNKFIINGIKNIGGKQDSYLYKLHVFDLQTKTWIKDVSDYSEKIEWKPEKIGKYILNIWAKSKTPSKAASLYEGWKLQAVTVKEADNTSQITPGGGVIIQVPAITALSGIDIQSAEVIFDIEPGKLSPDDFYFSASNNEEETILKVTQLDVKKENKKIILLTTEPQDNQVEYTLFYKGKNTGFKMTGTSVVLNVYVDDDFNDSTPYFGITRFNNIQDGIDIVNNGGTVHVAPGNYTGDHELEPTIAMQNPEYDAVAVITKPLTLEGPQANISPDNRRGAEAVIDALYIDNNNNYHYYTNNGIVIGSSDVNINGFTIANFEYGIKNIKPINQDISKQPANAMQNINITNNRFIDNWRSIIFNKRRTISELTNININSNLISTGVIYDYWGFAAFSQIDTEIEAQIDKTVSGIDESLKTLNTVNQTTTENPIINYECWGQGIVVDNLGQYNIQNNIVFGLQKGIIVLDRDDDDGSELPNINILHNYIHGNKVGIGLGYNISNVAINLNRIEFNKRSIGKNMNNNDYTIDLTQNWWGSEKVIDVIAESGYKYYWWNGKPAINILPWAINKECSELIKLNPGIMVDDDWKLIPFGDVVKVDGKDYYIGINAFPSIQSAVWAVPREAQLIYSVTAENESLYTIHIAPGKYTEAYIDRPLIIQGPGITSENDEGKAVVNGFIEIGSSDVTISGLKLDHSPYIYRGMPAIAVDWHCENININNNEILLSELENNQDINGNEPYPLFGIGLAGFNNNTIISSNIINNGYIFINGEESAPRVKQVNTPSNIITITNNKITNPLPFGIFIISANSLTLSDNIVESLDENIIGIQIQHKPDQIYNTILGKWETDPSKFMETIISNNPDIKNIYFEWLDIAIQSAYNAIEEIDLTNKDSIIAARGAVDAAFEAGAVESDILNLEKLIAAEASPFGTYEWKDNGDGSGTMTLTITNAHGNPISGLTANDFAVLLRGNQRYVVGSTSTMTFNDSNSASGIYEITFTPGFAINETVSIEVQGKVIITGLNVLITTAPVPPAPPAPPQQENPQINGTPSIDDSVTTGN